MTNWLRNVKMDSIILFCRENIIYLWLGLALLGILLGVIVFVIIKRRSKRGKDEASRIFMPLAQSKAWDSSLENIICQAGASLLGELPEFFPKLSPQVQKEIKRIAKEDLWLLQALNSSQVKPNLTPLQWGQIWQLIPNEDAFPRIIEFLAAKDEGLRMWGVEVIAALNDVRIIPYLLGALLQPKQYLPARVGEALLAYGSAAAGLLARMLPQLNKEGRILALNVLSQFGPVYPYKEVALALEDESEEIRAAAAAALGDSLHMEAFAYLLAASADTSWSVRSAVAKALGQIGDKRAVPRLQALLEDEAFWVRANAKEALEAILGAETKAGQG